jgi:hypothetical protein
LRGLALKPQMTQVDSESHRTNQKQAERQQGEEHDLTRLSASPDAFSETMVSHISYLVSAPNTSNS